MQNDKQLLVTVGQAAKMLACSDFTVRRAIWAGQLRSVRLGRAVRVRSDDLTEFVDKNTERAGEARAAVSR
ncbi:MAG TPA: helix-turn-helix domain-containing protein [Candidatus Dormibacteraeota bacterium]|nr:helix-turn-helix domain-containing protein [Candidatus Dormibacteraeota bacterium]